MKKRLHPYIFSLILFLGLILGIYSAYVFMTGFHNSDIGQNIMRLNVEYGLNLKDTTINGMTLTGEEIYSYGQKYMRQGFFLLGISALLIGFSLAKLIKFD